MKLITTILLLLGLLLAGILATETSLLFYWPACALLGLAGLFTGLRWRIRLSFAPSDLCLFSVVLLTGYLSARALTSPVVQYAREDLFIILGCFVAYLLTTTVLSHPRWRLALVALVALLILGNLAIGFVQFSGQWAFHVVPGFARTFGEGRVGGFFNNANHLAAFLVMAICLCSGLATFGRGSAALKLLLAFLSLAAGIGLVLTQSRGGLLALGCSMVALCGLSLWVVWQTQRHLFSRVLLGLSIAAVLGGAVLYQVGAEQMKKRLISRRADHDIRAPIWESARTQHTLSPTVGLGSRMFYDYCMTLRPASMQRRDLDALFVHNEYLQMLADYGWVGLALAVVAICCHLLHGLKFLLWFVREKYAHTGSLVSNTLALTLGAMAGLLGVLLHAGVEFHFHVAATALLAAVLAGLLANPGFDSEAGSRIKLPTVRPLAKVLLLLASGGLLYGSYQQGPADYAAARAALAASREDMIGQVDYLNESLAHYSLAPDPWYRRGLTWMAQWRPGLPQQVSERLLNKAVHDFQQAVSLAPQHYLYALALADAYDALREEDKALAAVQLALKAAPWHEEARLGLAMHLHRWQHFPEAERAYLWARDARLLNPEDSMNWETGYQQLMKDSGF
jgi:O-antigen ligase